MRFLAGILAKRPGLELATAVVSGRAGAVMRDDGVLVGVASVDEVRGRTERPARRRDP